MESVETKDDSRNNTLKNCYWPCYFTFHRNNLYRCYIFEYLLPHNISILALVMSQKFVYL